MKLTIQAALAAAIVSLAFATPGSAADPQTKTAQVEKRIDCTADKPGASKADCDARATAREPQTHKMVRCNEEAGKKQLHGEERRAFMSVCLRG